MTVFAAPTSVYLYVVSLMETPHSVSARRELGDEVYLQTDFVMTNGCAAFTGLEERWWHGWVTPPAGWQGGGYCGFQCEESSGQWKPYTSYCVPKPTICPEQIAFTSKVEDATIGGVTPTLQDTDSKVDLEPYNVTLVPDERIVPPHHRVAGFALRALLCSSKEANLKFNIPEGEAIGYCHPKCVADDGDGSTGTWKPNKCEVFTKPCGSLCPKCPPPPESAFISKRLAIEPRDTPKPVAAAVENARNHPKMSEATRKKLQEFYAPMNKELADLVKEHHIGYGLEVVTGKVPGAAFLQTGEGDPEAIKDAFGEKVHFMMPDVEQALRIE